MYVSNRCGSTSGGVYVPRMLGGSYRRRLRSLLLYLCYLFRVLSCVEVSNRSDAFCGAAAMAIKVVTLLLLSSPPSSCMPFTPLVTRLCVLFQDRCSIYILKKTHTKNTTPKRFHASFCRSVIGLRAFCGAGAMTVKVVVLLCG